MFGIAKYAVSQDGMVHEDGVKFSSITTSREITLQLTESCVHKDSEYVNKDICACSSVVCGAWKICTTNGKSGECKDPPADCANQDGKAVNPDKCTCGGDELQNKEVCDEKHLCNVSCAKPPADCGNKDGEEVNPEKCTCGNEVCEENHLCKANKCEEKKPTDLVWWKILLMVLPALLVVALVIWGIYVYMGKDKKNVVSNP